MRNKYLYILVVSVICFIAGRGEVCAQGLDSLRMVELTERLEEYFEALKYESIEVQKAECDFLIETADSREIRDFIAQTIYDHYVDSKIMGAEAVAIHLTDNWFVPGKVSFRDEAELFAARIFAEFNRQSQIGNKAPELEMESFDGGMMNVPGEDGGFKVLYFYDTDCAKCRLESIMLCNVLETEDFPVTLYAVYVGDNREAWGEYISDRLSLDGGKTVVSHLWDPAIDSDFQRKYGVLQTPRLFLIAPDGTILGRGLDTQALSQMLHGIFDEVELNYGGEESAALFEGLLPASARPSLEDVKGVADYIAESTLPKGDTVMFRQLTGDLLYHLAAGSGEGMKEGMAYLIENKILGQGRIWRSKDDSLKIIGFAEIMSDLLDKSRPGTRIADIKVPGELYTWKKEKNSVFRLSKLKGHTNIIIFYTEGCEVCKAEKQAAHEILSQAHSQDKELAGSARRINVLMVNVDALMSENPELAARLFDSFDLSSLPFIVTTDRKGVILHRYYSLL